MSYMKRHPDDIRCAKNLPGNTRSWLGELGNQRRTDAVNARLKRGRQAQLRGLSMGDWAKEEGVSRPYITKFLQKYNPLLAEDFKQKPHPFTKNKEEIIFILKVLSLIEIGIYTLSYSARLFGLDKAAITMWRKRYAEHGALDALSDYLDDEDYIDFIIRLRGCSIHPAEHDLAFNKGHVTMLEANFVTRLVVNAKAVACRFNPAECYANYVEHLAGPMSARLLKTNP